MCGEQLSGTNCTIILVYDSDVALQVLKEHPLAVRPQAGDHPETALGLVDPDVLSNVLHI